MVYLLKMVMFHGDVNHNQMVYSLKSHYYPLIIIIDIIILFVSIILPIFSRHSRNTTIDKFGIWWKSLKPVFPALRLGRSCLQATLAARGPGCFTAQRMGKSWEKIRWAGQSIVKIGGWSLGSSTLWQFVTLCELENGDLLRGFRWI